MTEYKKMIDEQLEKISIASSLALVALEELENENMGT